ncbi:MAG: nucleotidyl transferase AbiEii/AbiGii toxin family protein [Planctomycetes bacterium]|nr:nucleotidyl transferase AbiEii/AbiGii toxin family protein [Planctomycetota bacterium]
MTVPLDRPAIPDGLCLWVMHRFVEAFEEHALLKGSMALCLLDCPRSTNDLDYVFVPYRSTTAIRATIEAVLAELPDAEVTVALHSKMLRATVAVDTAEIQIVASVSENCASTPLPTGGFAQSLGQPSRTVRVIALGRGGARAAVRAVRWSARVGSDQRGSRRRPRDDSARPTAADSGHLSTYPNYRSSNTPSEFWSGGPKQTRKP